MIAAWKPFAATEASFRRKKVPHGPSPIPPREKASAQSRRLFLSRVSTNQCGYAFPDPIATEADKKAHCEIDNFKSWRYDIGCTLKDGRTL